MAKTYFTKLTQYGAAQLALATAGGAPIQLTHMAVGDGAGSAVAPIDTQTQLVGETYRAAINSLDVYQSRPNQIIAELIIPAEFGGWIMREAGLYDASGNLFAVANTPPSPKVSISEGSPSVQVIRILIEVSSTDSFELITDMTVVIATRDYVDAAASAGNQAHGWGNHASAGYIKSYVDTQYRNGTGLNLTGTEFIVKYGSAAGTAAQGNDSRINNGQSAYSWGNHASAGYIKSYVDTKYTAGKGLSLNGTSFIVKFGFTAGTVLEGNLNKNVKWRGAEWSKFCGPIADYENINTQDHRVPTGYYMTGIQNYRGTINTMPYITVLRIYAREGEIG